ALIIPLAVDADGALWFEERTDEAPRLKVYSGGAVQTVGLGVPEITVYTSMFQDREGTIWIGSDRGLFAIRESPLRVVGAEEGLQAPLVKAIAEDSDGSLLVGTWGGGVARVSAGRASPISSPERLIHSVGRSDDGALLLGASTGAYSLAAERTIQLFPGLARAIVASSPGTVLIGGGGLAEVSGGEAREVSQEPKVWALLAQQDAGAWVGTERGLYRYESAALSEPVVPEAWIVSLAPRDGGGLWLGSNGLGLGRFMDDQVQFISSERGILSDGVWCVLETRDDIWYSTNVGVGVVRKTELEQALQVGSDVVSRSFTELDGLPSREFNRGAPSCLEDRYGRLYFASIEGLVEIDPERRGMPEAKAEVRLVSVEVDGLPVELNADLSLPPGSHNITFRYTLPTLSAPTQAVFRYGFGASPEMGAWSGERVTTLTGVGRGDYVFALEGRDAWGRPSSNRASISMSVAPFWHQRMDVRGAVGLFLVGLLGAVVSTISKARQVKVLNEERLRIASDLHDELGSKLGAVTLKLDLLGSEAERSPVDPAKVSGLATSLRSISAQFRDIVWMINPEHDSDERLLLRMREHVAKTLAPGTWEFDWSIAGRNRTLDASWRRHLFLAFKEALYNAQRHAAAERISISAQAGREAFEFEIADNGVGFDPESDSPGNGLDSMARRAAEIDGQILVDSTPGNGCRIQFRAPYPRT
ncbi:MAG: hypothetical protein HKN29_06635, partial [Rhodothermales bacterium]|nr:hypothetical protein [Rhodothermales bacterium]